MINDIHERKRKGIHNILERDKESTIYTRDCEREKQERSKGHSRAFKEKVFQANFSTLIKSSFKAFKKFSIKVQLLLKRSFNSSSTLRKSKKEILHLSKVFFIVIFAYLRSYSCTYLCSKLSYSL